MVLGRWEFEEDAVQPTTAPYWGTSGAVLWYSGNDVVLEVLFPFPGYLQWSWPWKCVASHRHKRNRGDLHTLP